MTTPIEPPLPAYGIELHHHRFAAWAASRAASTSTRCRFEVQTGRAILEACGFTSSFARPEQLPEPQSIDDAHRAWRATAIGVAETHDRVFTHGIAAKLINVYLKSRFVLGGHHGHERVTCLHPPIDRVLLRTLAEQNLGGYANQWTLLAGIGWSNFNSDHYETVIELIRRSVNGSPLWMIEEHWRGNQ